jgi:hypothetical protein
MLQTGPCRFCRKVISFKPGSFRNHSRLINFLEDIFEPTIILFQNGVLGRHELNHLISRYSISLFNLALTNGIFLVKAILNEEWAKPVMDFANRISVSLHVESRASRTHFIRVVHCKCNAFTLEVVYIEDSRF